jgi:hypothetical protein
MGSRGYNILTKISSNYWVENSKTIEELAKKRDISIDNKVFEGLSLGSLKSVGLFIVDKILEKDYLFDHLGNGVSIHLKPGIFNLIFGLNPRYTHAFERLN